MNEKWAKKKHGLGHFGLFLKKEEKGKKNNENGKRKRGKWNLHFVVSSLFIFHPMLNKFFCYLFLLSILFN